VVLLAIVTVAFPSDLFAEPPAFYPVQGYLTLKDGSPVDGAVELHFTIYDAPVKGKALWSESQKIGVEDGVFTAYLGFDEPLGLKFFVDHTNVWLGIAVESDSEMQRVFLGTAPFSAYAGYCGEAPTHTHTVADVSGGVTTPQTCAAGLAVTGVANDGKLSCTPVGGVYSGADFALSGQGCMGGQVMVGTDAQGYPLCSEVASGKFALAGQSCPGTEVATGVDYSGNLVCDPSSAGGISGKGSTKRIPRFKDSTTLEDSTLYDSGSKVGVGTTSPSATLDVKGDLKVSGDFMWGGSSFSSSSCLVVGGSSCSSACSAHGMSCQSAFRIDGPSSGTSCSQSGFKFCCCKN